MIIEYDLATYSSILDFASVTFDYIVGCEVQVTMILGASKAVRGQAPNKHA